MEVAEQFADGDASAKELAEAWETAGDVSPTKVVAPGQHLRWDAIDKAAWQVANPMAGGRGVHRLPP